VKPLSKVDRVRLIIGGKVSDDQPITGGCLTAFATGAASFEIRCDGKWSRIEGENLPRLMAYSDSLTWKAGEPLFGFGEN
jgi:hypothetical protein